MDEAADAEIVDVSLPQTKTRRRLLHRGPARGLVQSRDDGIRYGARQSADGR